ncbi:MAG: FAD-binding oxidoreductase [Chlamydiales bacterium]
MNLLCLLNKKTMRIAILGAGFSGLSVAYFLLHYTFGAISIDVYDPEPIGEGISGLSSGLLHIYPGKEARRSWQGDHCLKDTHRLITVASEGIGKSVILSKGILRPALNQEQLRAFKRCADSHSDTDWWDYHQCLEKMPGLLLSKESGALYIKEGLTIDVKGYLQGLWQKLAKFGVQYCQSKLMRKNDLASYDRILIAIGPGVTNMALLKGLPIKPVKGQMLELAWPQNIPPLSISLNSSKYLVMSQDRTRCLVGATFEREFDSSNPDQKKAALEILPEIISFFPMVENAKILNCRSGLRATTPSHLPIAGQATKNIYFMTGLGSKGLLYHGWVGKRVARAIITKNISHIPKEIYYKFPASS